MAKKVQKCVWLHNTQSHKLCNSFYNRYSFLGLSYTCRSINNVCFLLLLFSRPIHSLGVFSAYPFPNRGMVSGQSIPSQVYVCVFGHSTHRYVFWGTMHSFTWYVFVDLFILSRRLWFLSNNSLLHLFILSCRPISSLICISCFGSYPFFQRYMYIVLWACQTLKDTCLEGLFIPSPFMFIFFSLT